MRKNLPTLRGLLLLSLLIGISIVSLKILTTLKNKETQLQNYNNYLTNIPTSIPSDVLEKIKQREKQLQMTIEEFEEEQNLYNPQSTQPQPTTSPTLTPPSE